MYEKQYAIANTYGFGICLAHHNYDGVSVYEFSKDVYVKFRGKRIGVPLPTSNLDIRLQDKMPLYLVSENGIWREFFTGVEVDVVDISYAQNTSRRGGNFDDKVIDIEKIHYHRRALRVLSAVGSNIVSAAVFANRISKYNDKQIKEMARQILQLKETSLIWGESYDKAVAECKRAQDEYNAATAARVADLDAKMGAYANVTNNSFKQNITNNVPASNLVSEKNNSNNEQTTNNPWILVCAVLACCLVLCLLLK